MSFAIAVVTIERPWAIQRFVESARRMFPDAPLYVADQSREIGAKMSDFYEANRVNVVRMDFDAGLSASRNRLMAMADAEFVALCDDDFVLGPETKFDAAAEILRRDEEIAVVGGRLHDVAQGVETVRHWEMFFHCDKASGIFMAVPIYNFAPVVRQVGPHTVYMCDAVMNFAVFRRSIFSGGFGWDEAIKINGEHEDFYLALKSRTKNRVAYFPGMAALHAQRPSVAAIGGLRERQGGWQYLLDKWQLQQHVEIGTGSRPLDGTALASWFCAGARASSDSRVVERMPDRLSKPAGADAGVSYLRIRLREPQARHEFVPQPLAVYLSQIPEAANSADVIATRVDFRYDAFEPGNELVLWYRAASADAGTPRRCMVFARWYSDAGTLLVWRSFVETLMLDGADYPRPLLFAVPLHPSGARYLKFELHAQAGDSAALLAVGLLFRTGSAEGRHHIDVSTLAYDPAVLATPNEAAHADRTSNSRVPDGVTCESAGEADILSIESEDVFEVTSALFGARMLLSRTPAGGGVRRRFTVPAGAIQSGQVRIVPSDPGEASGSRT